MLCVVLSDFPPNWRSRKLYFALICSALPDSALCKQAQSASCYATVLSASVCQTPRCASAVDSALFYALRRSARLRAVPAQSTLRSVMLCVGLPDTVLCERSR